MTWTVKKSIFDSWSEEKVHRALRHRWEERFSLFDHQPLLNVLETNLDDLSRADRDFAKSTSFDFTFTTRTGRPVLSIEYDGIGEGYSTVGGWELLARKFTDATGYHPSRIDIGRYPGRVAGLTFKVRAAADAFYPLLVVGTPEVRDIAPGVNLSLLDVMIGKLLVGQRLRAEASEYMEKLDPEGKFTDKQIQDALIDLEVAIEFEENPVHREYGDVLGDLLSQGFRWSYRVQAVAPQYNPSNPLEPDWVPAPQVPDQVWVGHAWVTEIEGVGPVETRFANRRVSFFGYDAEVLFWDVLELLHALHVREELTRAGKLPPLPPSKQA